MNYLPEVRKTLTPRVGTGGKQHISLDEKAPGIKALDDRFMNRWREPQHDGDTISTLRLLFPPWGLNLNAEQRDKSRSTWARNHVLINGHDDMVTVVSFVILDNGKTLRKKEDSPPSFPIGMLQMGTEKALFVIAGYEPEGDLRVKVDEALQTITATTELELWPGDNLTLCLTGWSAKDSAFILPLSVRYTPPPKK